MQPHNSSLNSVDLSTCQLVNLSLLICSAMSVQRFVNHNQISINLWTGSDCIPALHFRIRVVVRPCEKLPKGFSVGNLCCGPLGGVFYPMKACTSSVENNLNCSGFIRTRDPGIISGRYLASIRSSLPFCRSPEYLHVRSPSIAEIETSDNGTLMYCYSFFKYSPVDESLRLDLPRRRNAPRDGRMIPD